MQALVFRANFINIESGQKSPEGLSNTQNLQMVMTNLILQFTECGL